MRKITSIYILIIITIAAYNTTLALCNTAIAPYNTTLVLRVVINLFRPILFNVFKRFHIFVRGQLFAQGHIFVRGPTICARANYLHKGQ